jgi:hypothetical protein
VARADKLAAAVGAPLELLFEAKGERAWYFTMPGAKAIATWERLRAAAEETGHWPVLLGNEEDREKMVETRVQGGESTKKLLEWALAENCDAWLEERYREILGDQLGDGYVELPDDPNESVLSPDNFAALPRGTWPRGAGPRHRFSTPTNILTGKFQETTIALVPTAEAWQAPIYLRFGAFNSCPGPSEHAAFFLRWQDRYDAEVVALADDVVEMRVGKPPTKRQDALLLAREQYLYCRDIVDQGTQTLELLAAGLLKGTAWYFWWD